MYHRVWPNVQDALTVTPQSLRAQWEFLRDDGYECLTMERFLAMMRAEVPAPKKAFLITFNDGYRNTLEHALPLLEEFGWEATNFIIAGAIDGTYAADRESGPAAKMDADELRRVAGPHMRLGLHGYQHENFSGKKLEQIEAIIRRSVELFEEASIPFTKVLAYPYGARPKDQLALQVLKAWMSNFGIEAAFGIGNRPQAAPALDLYELKRIDMRGEDTLDDFKLKIRRGRTSVL
jgi:peptidoglycan/xylan/chitin deacetylase (PgdA/CDA1 family)